MSTFSKILNEKLKKKELPLEEIVETTQADSLSSGLGIDLLKWLNAFPMTQKNFYKVEDSSYSMYKKDPEVLLKQRLEREKRAYDAFLAQFSSEKDRGAVKFFYAQGARTFMSMMNHDLKRDFKRLAVKLHPDMHFNEIPSVQREFEENFRVLSESYETLKVLFSRAK